MNRARYRRLGQTLFVYLSQNPGSFEWRRSFIYAICDELQRDNPRFDRDRFIVEARLDELLEPDFQTDSGAVSDGQH